MAKSPGAFFMDRIAVRCARQTLLFKRRGQRQLTDIAVPLLVMGSSPIGSSSDLKIRRARYKIER